MEEFSHPQPVLKVRMRPDLCLVMLETKIYMYSIDNGFAIAGQVEITPNPTGLMALTRCEDTFVLAIPHSTDSGQVMIKTQIDGGDTYLDAAEEPLRCLELTYDGRFIAAVSLPGKHIRIFDTVTKQMLHKLRSSFKNELVDQVRFSRQGDSITLLTPRTLHSWIINLSVCEQHNQRHEHSV